MITQKIISSLFVSAHRLKNWLYIAITGTTIYTAWSKQPMTSQQESIIQLQQNIDQRKNIHNNIQGMVPRTTEAWIILKRKDIWHNLGPIRHPGKKYQTSVNRQQWDELPNLRCAKLMYDVPCQFSATNRKIKDLVNYI